MSDYGDQSETLDAGQAIKAAYDKDKIAHRVIANVPLVTESYDEVSMSYISSGNGTGEIGTVIYKKAGTPVAVLSLTYDSSNRLIDVLRL